MAALPVYAARSIEFPPRAGTLATRGIEVQLASRLALTARERQLIEAAVRGKLEDWLAAGERRLVTPAGFEPAFWP